MRRIVFIILAVIVAALVGLFCWREFAIPGINFVADFTNSDSEHHIRVQRLYAAEVDHDAFNEALEKIMNTTEYTEEEIYLAAIASGIPEFFPSFSIGVYREGEEIRVDSILGSDYAEGQKDRRFRLGDIGLEVVSAAGDLVIESVDVSREAKNEDNTVIRINSQQQAAVDLTGSTGFRITMNGDGGTVTLRFTYSIESDTFMPKTVLTEQFLELSVVITPGAGVNLDTAFIVSPYSNLEDLDN